MSTRSKLEGLVAELTQAKARRTELEAQFVRLTEEMSQIDKRIGRHDEGLRGAVYAARKEYLNEISDGLAVASLEACDPWRP